MSITEVACFSTPEQARLKVRTLPFDRIPNQSKLFLDYINDPSKVAGFYGGATRYLRDPAERSTEILDNYSVDRNRLCKALERLNRSWNAPEEVFQNIERLAGSDCITVVSGQQVGLFTGPLYTIYKALSAVKLADCMTQRGVNAVPVFWMATEDHDFDEIAPAEFIGCDCRLANVTLPSNLHRPGTSVGGVVLDSTATELVNKIIAILPGSEFIPDLDIILRDSYAPGVDLGDAFARMMLNLLGNRGLILLDPRDLEVKKLAAPLYSKAARRAGQIGSALEARSQALIEAGYHAQVAAGADSFPLFIHSALDERQALTRTEAGRYRTKTSNEEYTAEDVALLAEREPHRFSPNVTLRAVVQDYLLPTAVYFGGSAEIAYFAQTSVVCQTLDRPVTPILHRASITMVETRTGKTLERYGLELEDLFSGPEAIIARVVENYLGADAARRFVSAETVINSELDILKKALREIDPTLSEALEGGRKKINHQIEGLRSRFHRAQMSRDQAVHRQLERAFALLYPEKSLQERHLNIVSMLARHGKYVIDWIYDAIDLNSAAHTIVYL